VIARETIKSVGKNVTPNATAATSAESASCSRSKRKAKSDETHGQRGYPQEAFLAILESSD